MLIITTLLFACASDPAPKPEVTSTPSKKGGQGASEQLSLMPKQPAPNVDITPPPVAEVNSIYDPLTGKSLLEICQSDALSLIKWSFEERQSKSNELCCIEGGFPEDAIECMLDWPSSDVPSCSIYDEMRNGIFARYGRSFQTKKWKDHFASKDWYIPRDDFIEVWINPVAMANVRLLVDMKNQKINCLN
jgi:hypothetical protein